MAEVLFVNDTSAEKNPGCRAVSFEIKRVLSSRYARVHSMALGVWTEPFADLNGVQKRCVLKDAKIFPRWNPVFDETLDTEGFYSRLDRLVAEAPEWESLRDVDEVIVNGEGSIHHNFPRAIGLTAFMLACVRRKKRVSLVNCTLQAMNPVLMRDLLGSLHRLEVRESFSETYARSLGGRPVRLPDRASAHLGQLRLSLGLGENSVAKSRSCFFCPGVAANLNHTLSILDLIAAKGFRPVYLAVLDKPDAELLSVIQSQREVATLRADDEADLGGFLRTLAAGSLVISGRHHINLYAACAGLPVLPLRSNTWKIEGTLTDMNYPVAVSDSLEELSSRWDEVARDPAGYSERSRRSFDDYLTGSRSFAMEWLE